MKISILSRSISLGIVIAGTASGFAANGNVFLSKKDPKLGQKLKEWQEINEDLTSVALSQEGKNAGMLLWNKGTPKIVRVFDAQENRYTELVAKRNNIVFNPIAASESAEGAFGFAILFSPIAMVFNGIDALFSTSKPGYAGSTRVIVNYKQTNYLCSADLDNAYTVETPAGQNYGDYFKYSLYCRYQVVDPKAVPAYLSDTDTAKKFLLAKNFRRLTCDGIKNDFSLNPIYSGNIDQAWDKVCDLNRSYNHSPRVSSEGVISATEMKSIISNETTLKEIKKHLGVGNN